MYTIVAMRPMIGRNDRMLKIRFTTKAIPRMISQKGLVFLSAAR
ncbi:hypothetical protein STENM36S_03086 [Streptomyces tendae]